MSLSASVSSRVHQAINNRVFPGCVVGIVRRNGEREILPFGHFTYEASPGVAKNTIYDVASITKSIPTASLALTLLSEGKIKLDDTVKTYLPELQNDHGASIEDLLRYRVKGVQMSKLQHKTFEEIRTHVLEEGFSGPAGDGAYTNLPAYVLGMIVERVGEGTLPALADERFFGPLGMSDTTFFPHDIARVVPTEIDERGEVRALPHDESAYVFARARRAAGHAGLFSTAGDILTFLEALLRGELQVVSEGAEKGLGWQLNSPYFMGAFAGPQTFGKTGFTGTSIVCESQRGVGFVILSNRTYPKRPPDDSAIFQLRADIADLILGSSA